MSASEIMANHFLNYEVRDEPKRSHCVCEGYDYMIGSDIWYTIGV